MMSKTIGGTNRRLRKRSQGDGLTFVVGQEDAAAGWFKLMLDALGQKGYRFPDNCTNQDWRKEEEEGGWSVVTPFANAPFFIVLTKG